MRKVKIRAREKVKAEWVTQGKHEAKRLEELHEGLACPKGSVIQG